MREKVQVWVHAKGQDGERKFLLLRTRPERGDFWQPVTGSVEEGESLSEAASREAREETGLKQEGAPETIGYEFSFDRAGSTFHETGFSVEARTRGKGLPEVVLSPEEHVEYRWVSEKEAHGMMKFESNQKMLRKLLERLGSHGASEKK